MSVGVFHHIQREASALLVYRDGHTRASNRETSNKYRLSRFFYLRSNQDESIGLKFILQIEAISFYLYFHCRLYRNNYKHYYIARLLQLMCSNSV